MTRLGLLLVLLFCVYSFGATSLAQAEQENVEIPSVSGDSDYSLQSFADGNQPMIPPILINACSVQYVNDPHALNPPACEALTRWIEKKRNYLEQLCIETRSIRNKKNLTEQLWLLAEEIDELLELALPLELDPMLKISICGGFLDPEITYIDVEPIEAKLDARETVDLSAVIRCSNGICVGNLEWESMDSEIASVEETTQARLEPPETAQVTAGDKDGTTLVIAGSSNLQLIQWGSAEITVGEKPIVDIVFTIDNQMWMGWWIGSDPGQEGLRDHGRDLIDAMKDHFDLRSRVAIVTYNRPNISPYTATGSYPACLRDWGPTFYAFPSKARTHQYFRQILWTDGRGFDSLSATCASPNDWDYIGSFVYSALRHSIFLNGWRDSVDGRPVKRIIALIDAYPPAGPYAFPFTVEPEPFTYYTSENVIHLAQKKNIEVHVFNLAYNENLLLGWPGQEGNRAVFSQIASETGGTYQEPQFDGAFPDDLLYLGIIDKMDEMAD